MAEHEPAALYLALGAVPGVGPVSAQALLSAFGSPAALLAGAPPAEGWDALPMSLPPPLAARLAAALPPEAAAGARAHVGPSWHAPLVTALRRGLPAALGRLERARQLGLQVISRDDSGYPPSLVAGVDAPPNVLFVAGQLPEALSLPSLEVPAIAVVGARGASRYSLSLARELASDLSAAGVTVVSGLALGVDAAAHEGALAGGGAATVAVLGSGHARLHPRNNAALAERIVRSDGAVISEWPPDTDPQRGHFPWRNRIISALSRAVVVVEAAAKSGALSTAGHALAQGRTVLVVPDRPDSVRAAGNLGLLRDGASPLIDASDALALFPDVLARWREQAATQAGTKPPSRGATGANEMVLAALKGGAWHAAEALAGELRLPPRVLLAALTELEIEGAVQRESGLYRSLRRAGSGLSARGAG